MSETEVHTHRAAPTGSATARWRERTGDQKFVVKVDPSRDERLEFRVEWSRRWGHQIGDVREDGLWLPREGAERLRDALTAALDWAPDPAPEPASPTRSEP